ncbi:hypothetical protein BsWGS_15015 [Bradybaena similaris]
MHLIHTGLPALCLRIQSTTAGDQCGGQGYSTVQYGGPGVQFSEGGGRSYSPIWGGGEERATVQCVWGGGGGYSSAGRPGVQSSVVGWGCSPVWESRGLGLQSNMGGPGLQSSDSVEGRGYGPVRRGPWLQCVEGVATFQCGVEGVANPVGGGGQGYSPVLKGGGGKGYSPVWGGTAGTVQCGGKGAGIVQCVRPGLQSSVGG